MVANVPAKRRKLNLNKFLLRKRIVLPLVSTSVSLWRFSICCATFILLQLMNPCLSKNLSIAFWAFKLVFLSGFGQPSSGSLDGVNRCPTPS